MQWIIIVILTIQTILRELSLSLSIFSLKCLQPPRKEKRNEKEEEEDQDEEEEEEEEGEEPPSHLNLIWDEEEFEDDEDDDIMEEACIGTNYNLRSKGAPKTNVTPSTSKTNNKSFYF